SASGRSGPILASALETLTTSSALNSAARGRVNAVAPGPVRTGWIGDDLLVQVEQMGSIGRAGSSTTSPTPWCPGLSSDPLDIRADPPSNRWPRPVTRGRLPGPRA